MKPIRPGARMTSGRVEHRAVYSSYLKSAAWQARRRLWWDEFHDRYGDRPLACPGGCGTILSPGHGDFHHRTYDRLGPGPDGVGREEWEDLTVVCRPCHTDLHAAIDSSPGWRGMPRDAATDSILAAMRDARKRPSHD